MDNGFAKHGGGGFFIVFMTLFLLVFGPVIDSSLGPFADTSFLISIMILVICLRRNIPRELLLVFSLLFCITLLALLTAVVNDSNIVEIAIRTIIRPIKAAVVIFSIFLLITYYKKNSSFRRDDLLYILFLCIVFHSLIMSVQFFSVEFRDFIYNFTMAKYQLEHYQNFRMAGLSGGGGAQLSFTQSFGFLIGLYLLSRNDKNKFILHIGCVFIIISVFLSGRSGFVFILLSCLIFAARVFKYVLYSPRSLFKASFVIIVLIFITPLLNIEMNEFVQTAFERNFATFINYSETGNVEDRTLIALSEMIIVPDTFGHLIFGVASYLENNTYYDINTDIGYFRLIWGYGVIGLTLHILVYAVLWLLVINNAKLDTLGKHLLLMSFFFVFLFNAKEIAFFSKMSFQIFLIIVFTLLLIRDKDTG